MASVNHLYYNASIISRQILQLDRELECERTLYHYSALLLQRVWRGYRVRRELRKLHEAATVLEKHIRGFLARLHVPDFMAEYIRYTRMKYYYTMAAKIQALWRGYWHRTRVLNLREMFEIRKRIARANAELSNLIKEQNRKAEEERRRQAEAEAKHIVLFIVFKLHHHLRTQQEGIYSLHNKKDYSYVEKFMKSLRFTNYMKQLKKLYNETYKVPEKEYLLKGVWRKCEKAYYLRDKSHDEKPQKTEDQSHFYKHKKPFCFNPRIQKKYEPEALPREKFIPAIRDMVRTIDPSLNFSQHDFDITAKMVEGKFDVPPYYIDFWERICEIHNFPDID